MNITYQQYPQIWRVCLLVLYDNGAINREEPEPRFVQFPEDVTAIELGYIDFALRALSSADLDILACGEQVDTLRVAVKSQWLALLHVLLNLWFDDGMPRG